MENYKSPPEPSTSLSRRTADGAHTVARHQYTEIPATAYIPDNGDDLGQAGLIEYWRILSRHKGTWIIFVFAGALLGFLISLPRTRIYQARISVEIVNLNDNFLNLKQASPVAEGGTNLDVSDIQTQITILKSESLLDRAIAKLNKANQNGSAQPETTWAAWRKALNLPEPPPQKKHELALKAAAKSVKVRATGQTRIIEITVDSPDRQLATDFANTLANEFIEQNLESRWKTTERTTDWLGRQLEDMRVKLEHSEDALQIYARNSKLVFTDEKTSVAQEKLKQLQEQLSAATADRITKQSRYEMAQNSPPDALPDVLNDAQLRGTHDKITDLKRQIAQLRATFTAEFKAVRRAEAELETLQAAFDADRAAILTRIRNEYEEALRKEKLLSAAYNAQTTQVTGEGEKSIQYNILKREADSNRQLYDAMLQQMKESTIASAMRASNIRIIDPAKIPWRPYKPNTTQSAGLGLLAGIFVGAAFIVMRERADRTIQQPGDANLYLNVPELGVIPSEKAGSSRLRYSLSGASDGKPKSGAEPGSYQVELATWQRKPCVVAESFRSTLISILFANDKGPPPKVLVFASASPGEGKSTITSNLSIAMAETGQRVLLIDADMRRPRQHDIFAIENTRGLSTILREKVALNGDKSLGGILRQTDIPGLFILTSGPSTSAATTLLYGSRMPDLLNYLRNEFDVVLVDTPPMLQMPDARVIGRMADRVIMVIRSGHTTRDAAVAARQRFNEDGIKVMGTILNDWNPQSTPNGYYGYYHSKTYHYPDDQFQRNLRS
jgi:polysaccharide biosynthesis transport protein